MTGCLPSFCTASRQYAAVSRPFSCTASDGAVSGVHSQPAQRISKEGQSQHSQCARLVPSPACQDVIRRSVLTHAHLPPSLPLPCDRRWTGPAHTLPSLVTCRAPSAHPRALKSKSPATAPRPSVPRNTMQFRGFHPLSWTTGRGQTVDAGSWDHLSHGPAMPASPALWRHHHPGHAQGRDSLVFLRDARTDCALTMHWLHLRGRPQTVLIAACHAQTTADEKAVVSQSLAGGCG